MLVVWRVATSYTHSVSQNMYITLVTEKENGHGFGGNAAFFSQHGSGQLRCLQDKFPPRQKRVMFHFYHYDFGDGEKRNQGVIFVKKKS